MAASSERPLGWVGRVALLALLVVGALVAAGNPFSTLPFLSYGLVGAYLAARRPGNAIGWLLVAIAVGFVGTSTSPDWDVSALARGDASLRDELSAWFGWWSGTATFVGFLGLTIIFPSGRIPSGRGRRTSIVLLSLAILTIVLAAIAPTIGITPVDGADSIVVPNPVGLLPELPTWVSLPIADSGVVVVIGLLLIGVVRMVLRYRRATGIERLQLRWLVAAVALVLTGLLVGLAFAALADVGGLGWLPVNIAFPMIPLAIGMAVMRYRLFEIDRIVSRSVAYVIVTGVLAAVYGAVVLLLSTLLAQVGQGQTIAVATSTLVVFALFQPVLGRTKRAVDRRFNRARYDADLTAAAFSTRLRDQVDIGAVAADLDTTVRRAVDPTALGLWLRTPRHELARSSDAVTIPGRSGGKLSAT